MFLALPFRDEPRPAARPVVTLGLIGLNVGIYLLVTLPLSNQLVNPGDPAVADYLRSLAARTGASPAALLPQINAYEVFTHRFGYGHAGASPLSLFTYMFLHGGILHLAGNMLFLWVAGANVEHRFGRVPFLLAYLIGGGLAALTFGFVQGGATVVGASGAVYTVLGMYFLWFPRNRVHIFVLLIWIIRVLPVPARFVLGGYVLVADLLPLLADHESDVAHSAHVGGFLAGLGIAWVASHYGWVRDSAVRSGATRRPHRMASVRESFVDAAHADDWRGALRAYERMSDPERDGLPVAGIFGLADWLTRGDHHEPALAVLRRFIAAHPTSPHLAEAHLRAGLVHLRGTGRRAAAYEHLLAVLDLESSAEEQRLARGALAEMDLRPPTH